MARPHILRRLVSALGAPTPSGSSGRSTAGGLLVAISEPADASGNVQVNGTAQGALTNRSGTITLGGTAQSLAAAKATRRYLFVQNLDASAALWIDFGATAVASQPSIKIPAGQSFVMEGSFVSTDAVSVIGPNTSQAFTAKEG